jgi:hypothetical protein
MSKRGGDAPGADDANIPRPSLVCPQRAQEGRVRCVYIYRCMTYGLGGYLLSRMVSRQLGIEMLWHDNCHDRLCRTGFVSDLVTSKVR